MRHAYAPSQPPNLRFKRLPFSLVEEHFAELISLVPPSRLTQRSSGLEHVAEDHATVESHTRLLKPYPLEYSSDGIRCLYSASTASQFRDPTSLWDTSATVTSTPLRRRDGRRPYVLRQLSARFQGKSQRMHADGDMRTPLYPR